LLNYIRLYSIKWRDICNWLCQNNTEGSVDTFYGTIPGSAWKNWKKPWKLCADIWELGQEIQL